MLSGTEPENPRPAASVTSLLSSSSSSSAASATSATGQSSSLAAATAVHKMDAELRCPACHRYFHCPVLLPCGHSLCTACAAGALLPSTEPSIAASIHNIMNLVSSGDSYRAIIPGAPHSSSSSASSTAGSSITGSSLAGTVNMNVSLGTASVSQQPTGSSSHSDSDQLSVVSETDSGVVVSSRPGSYIGRLPAIFCQSTITAASAVAAISGPGVNQNPSSAINLNLITHGLICPSCNRTVGLLDEHGLSQLPRNRALERVIGKFVSPDQLQEKPIIELGTFPLLPPSDPTSRPGGPLCQLCEEPEDPADPSTDPGSNISHSSANLATTWCEQCEIFYCTPCRERCHPSRGPLVRHCLHTAAKGVEITKRKRQNQPAPCPLHPHMLTNLFCVQCQTQVCHECLVSEGNTTHDNHGKHEVQPLTTICKARKAELSQALQSLSERARAGTECIQRLRIKSEAYNHKMFESERQVTEQLDALIRTLEKKKADLTERLRTARDEKVQFMREQITQVTQMLTKSTGLIQFCIEMLKEGDPTAFLVVSQSLVTRTHETENLFIQELEQASAMSDHAEAMLHYSVCSTPTTITSEQQRRNSPRKTSKSGKSDLKGSQRLNEFTLEQNSIETIRRAINELRLSEEQGKKSMNEEDKSVADLQPNEVPAAPRFIVEACISERNVITLVWQPTTSIVVTKYTLELDDGANGNFRKVYRGPETICTVEGLHFRSVYRARVKAHNPAGESLYSERLCLQTSDLTWFHMDPSTACPDILLTNGNRTITSQINEDRVILGSTGLSRGVHYWEFTVDRCDPGGQPAFGIARVDCNKAIMLGLDMRSWSVYFDHKRSWFLHNGEHFERTDGGVLPGSVVGVRLDFNRGSLSYYLNDEPHGPIAFTNLPAGIYYPAVSLSRAVQLTLHSGLEAPSESEESDEDSSGGGTGTETTSMATTVLAVPSNKSYSHQSASSGLKQ